jgi:hypothetical protein
VAVGLGAERTCGLDLAKRPFSPVSTTQDEHPDQDAPFSAYSPSLFNQLFGATDSWIAAR